MVPIDNLNNEEIQDLVYKVGEIILSVARPFASVRE